VCKCFYAGGEMLIKESSSAFTTHLYAYLPSGADRSEVQNRGGSRYSGTVTSHVGADPLTVTIISSAGGNTTVPTTSFLI